MLRAVAKHLLQVLILVASALSLRSQALPCLHRSQLEPQSLLTKVVEYADSDTHRETIEEYAASHSKDVAEVAASTAATGKLICGKTTATANLVIKDDVIVGAGHMLTDPNTCMKLHDASECKFQVLNQPPVPVEALMKTGIACPQKANKGSDWAILKLSRPIQGIKPYRIEERPLDGISVNKPIKLVAAMSVDFRRLNPKSKKVEYPKHIQDCSVKRLFYIYSPLVFASNCDGSSGKSGGAILSGDLSDPALVGISVRVAASEETLQREAKTGKPTRNNFNDESWYDSSIALAGEFLTELRAATK